MFYGSFFMPKFRCKEGLAMFSDEILEKIFSHPETKNIPIAEQAAMIQVIELVLEEMGVNTDATLFES